jgi:hypothetical protein
MKRAKLFIICGALLIAQSAWGQNRMIDLNVMPLVPDSITPAGMVDVSFEIKTENPENLQNIIVLVGILQDDGSLFTDSVQIVPDSTGYATLYNSQQSFIENYQAQWMCRFTQLQWDQYEFITVYGILAGATETTHLYWKKVTL